MSEADKTAEVWPFHEMIVVAIRNPELDSDTWCWIICHTLIPAGHDAILEALEEENEEPWEEEVALAKKHVLEQKRLAEEKATVFVDDDDSATPPDSVAAATAEFQGMNQ